MKRFSLHETAFLCLPLAVTALGGWWMSKRHVASPENNRVGLTFHLEKPTTLEAFQGNDVAFVVEARDHHRQNYGLLQASPYLQVQTPRGLQTSRQSDRSSLLWGGMWGGNVNSSRFPAVINKVPSGQLCFGFDGFIQPFVGGVPPLSSKPTRVKGKWRVERADIEPVPIAALPRKPLISLLQVQLKNTQVKSGAVSGIAIFHLEGAAMGKKTPVEINFSSGQGMGWGLRTEKIPKDKPGRRVYEWTIYMSSPAPRLDVSGRVSADNHWPLGFQIEPFNWKTAKVGQKLKFKTFPVPLPSLLQSK